MFRLNVAMWYRWCLGALEDLLIASSSKEQEKNCGEYFTSLKRMNIHSDDDDDDDDEEEEMTIEKAWIPPCHWNFWAQRCHSIVFSSLIHIRMGLF